MATLTRTEQTARAAGTSSIGIFYEHPRWFEPLFAEFERRGTPALRLKADEHLFEPGQAEPAALIFNRMSPSAYRRTSGDSIFYTADYLDHLHASGVRVVNGAKAFRFEVSKAAQLTLLHRLGLPFPRAKVIHRADDALRAAADLRFPVVSKPNVGGSGAGVVRFNSPAELQAGIAAGRIDLGLDGVALIQEFIPARDGHITRVEVVGRKFLYAIKVFLTGETFDLCPADICRTSEGVQLENSCPVEAPKAGLRVEGYRPPSPVIADVERIMAEADIEVGGVEYVVDDRDGKLLYYDINALSNFVASAETVVGLNPFSVLADYLEKEASGARPR